MNEKPFEARLKEVEKIVYKNSFERKFRGFVVYPGVVFTFIAGIYYVVYLAPDMFSKLIMSVILVLGGVLWLDECLTEIKKRLEM